MHPPTPPWAAAGKLFQPVPYSPGTPHGMPAEFEEFYQNPEVGLWGGGGVNNTSTRPDGGSNGMGVCFGGVCVCVVCCVFVLCHRR